MIVSKLNPMPFHSVNSPLVDPVSNRLPSGVHRTTLTGCLILLSDEWRCFAGIVSAGFIKRAPGGSIFTMVSIALTATNVLEKDHTDIDNVAWARPFLLDLHFAASSMLHPLHHSGAVVGLWPFAHCSISFCLIAEGIPKTGGSVSKERRRRRRSL